MRISILCFLLLLSFFLQAQSRRDTTISNYSAYKRSLSFAGLLQTRYTYSLNKQVDVNGKHFPDTVKGNTNSFSLKRVRFQAKAQINDHFDATILVNFADFSSSNVASKVLENAFVRYSLSPYFHVIAGQYRPFFGIEDAIPVDLIRSLDYSNQYTAFGSSGWQSFQLGVSVYGNINTDSSAVPLRYFAGVHNGNNKNQPADNDNSKHMYARLEADLGKRVTIGVNAANGSTQEQHGNAWGADIRSRIRLADKWSLNLNAEYKEGSNFAAYNAFTGNPRPAISEFKMSGFYIFPQLRYEFKHPRMRAIELSSRYEYFDESSKRNSNPRQTIIPMLAMEFADNYFVCLQIGVNIDLYKNDIPHTTQYSHNAAVAQLQVRF